MLTSLAVFAATGALAGFLAGLLGIGGGMVLVPALIFSFEAQGVSPNVLTHLAIGTSLASIVLTSISSVRTHHAQGGVDVELFKRLAIGLVIGSWFGAQIAHALPARTLQLIIGIFAVWTGLRMFRGSKPIAADAPAPSATELSIVGGVIGVASAIFGIGGGSLMVPYLIKQGVAMRRAVGTAAACGFPIAIAGMIGFIYSGWGLSELPTGSTGYIYWPALAGIALTSMVAAHGGAVMAHRLPAQQLKRAFGVLLVLVGVRFLVGI